MFSAVRLQNIVSWDVRKGFVCRVNLALSKCWETFSGVNTERIEIIIL